MNKILKNIFKGKILDYLIKGIYAGVMIGIGCTAYLATDNKYIGAILFATSILIICMYGMSLFSAKIGYFLVNKSEYIKELISSLVGNFIGISIVALFVSRSNLDIYQEKALVISNSVLDNNITSVFLLSILFGFLLYIAINNYKKVSGEIGKYIAIFLTMLIAIICGFEHSLSNLFYIILSNVMSIKAILYLSVMIVGNSIGSILIATFYNKFYKN